MPSKPNGLLCSVCSKPQFNSPGGPVCEDGHGGVEGVDSFVPSATIVCEEISVGGRHIWSAKPAPLDTSKPIGEIIRMGRSSVGRPWHQLSISEAEHDLPAGTKVYVEPRGLKDHEIALVVNELRDIAIRYHGTQQLRERIAQVVVPALRRTATPQSPTRTTEQDKS